MDADIVFASGFAPGIFWLWYFYKQDVLEPEPKRLVIKTFVLGMVAVIPASILEAPFSDPWLLFLAAPIIEETAKFLVVWFFVYDDPNFNEPVDGIVYAAATALGFASIENSGYLLSVYLKPEGRPHYSVPIGTLEATIGVFIVRALLSVPGHVLWSALWGHELGRAKLNPTATSPRAVAIGLGYAITAHGLFNVLVSSPHIAWAAVLLILIGWRIVRQRITQDIALSPFLTIKKRPPKDRA